MVILLTGKQMELAQNPGPTLLLLSLDTSGHWISSVLENSSLAVNSEHLGRSLDLHDIMSCQSWKHSASMQLVPQDLNSNL